MVESTELIRRFGKNLRAAFRDTFAEMPDVLTFAMMKIAQVESEQFNRLNVNLRQSAKRPEPSSSIQASRAGQELDSAIAESAPISKALVRRPATSGPLRTNMLDAAANATSSFVLLDDTTASVSHEPCVLDQDLHRFRSIERNFAIASDNPWLGPVRESSGMQGSFSAQLQLDQMFEVSD